MDIIVMVKESWGLYDILDFPHFAGEVAKVQIRSIRPLNFGATMPRHALHFTARFYY